jgi:hypothetical protein
MTLAAFVENDLARLDIGRLRACGEACQKCGGKNENLGLHNLLLRSE